MTPDQGPQFDQVEYQQAPGSNTCVLCNQPISGSYYRINGQQVCSACTERERILQRDTAKNYSRALTFGIGAAIIGLIGYATFEIATGWIIGYLSLGVGWLIAKAMLKGSGGLGGRKYQITAVLLTYFAVSMAAIPVIFAQISKQKKEHQAQVQTQPGPNTATSSPASPNTSSSDADSEPGDATAEPKHDASAPTAKPTAPASNAATPNRSPAGPVHVQPQMGLAKALAGLFFIGLASPFLELSDPFHGLIGLFILFIGMRIAWTMTGRPRMTIDGPF